ncbi:hypothetical protein JB92DRAFT_2941484 [Gautieria morchelliformis]|nr:hypothetical protein JB92DRAFT_2941484 [Gautieria morchelliformis]
MSSGHRDVAYSSRTTDPNDRRLPPIREVFRDELGRPAQPSPYSFREVQSALPTPGHQSQRSQWDGYAAYHGRDEQRGPATLPPMQHYAGTGHLSHTQERRHPAQGPPPSQHAGRRRGSTDEPGYSYGVLRTSGTSGSLTDATPPSDRPQGILRQTAAPAREDPGDLNKRYKCDYCGKRFGMPSHLQIHLRTHTAQRPAFACEWPGCDRTFSVRSNMTRHFRSHDKHKIPSQSMIGKSKYEDEDDDDTGGEQDEPTSSSHYFHSGSSTNKVPSAQFYSSSRRK